MNLLALALCLGLPASAASRPAEILRASAAAFEAKEFRKVVDGLTEENLQRLRYRDLPEAYILLGRSHEQLDANDKALGIYQLAEGLFPKNVNILSYWADLLHRIGLDDRARPVYDRILKLRPGNALANLGMAEISLHFGFLDRAADHYETALNEWDTNPSIWRAFAEVLSLRRDHARAIAAIERSISLGPDPESTYALARFQRAAGRTEEAYANLAAAIAANPGRDDLPHRRALWLLADGKLDDCLAEAEAALKRSGEDDPLALWLRASVRLRQGRATEARKDLERAALFEVEAPFVASVSKAMLESLRGAP